MSVSLIALQIEISDELPLLSHIHYTAPKFLSKIDLALRPSSDDKVPSDKKASLGLRHRGSRELHEISIETVQMTDADQPAVASKRLGNLGQSSSKEMSPELMVGPAANQIQFFSGNHFVEVTKGILHLFKENKPTTLGEEAERSELIAMLSVPTSMTTHDLLQFTAPVQSDIENLRVIRDTKPNQYIVLVKFRNQRSADEFYNNFNGVAFNSIEPEMCHLVYVAHVESLKEGDEKCGRPIRGLTELPTCPVCLERMDESVEGILTILCNHSFHGNCLEKWGDTSCPVCRYTQTPEPAVNNRCFECAGREDQSGRRTELESLWICLVCGHIGCGRYLEGHAYKHYVETQHTYAMQLENNRVWDYAGDNYVHRLLQNKSDGKVVEVECNPSSQGVNDEKIDAVQLEFTYLLTNQLETQRKYFEDSITRIEKDAQEQIKEILEKTKITTEEREKVQEQYNEVFKDKVNIEKKLNAISAKLLKVITELEEEKSLNKCLRENQSSWQKELADRQEVTKKIIEEKDHQIAELKDQVRDLMFYLEAQQKLQHVPDASKEEIESGTILVGASPASTSSSGSKGRKPRKK